MREFIEARDKVSYVEGGNETVHAFVTILKKHAEFEVEIGQALSGNGWQIDFTRIHELKMT